MIVIVTKVTKLCGFNLVEYPDIFQSYFKVMKIKLSSSENDEKFCICC